MGELTPKRWERVRSVLERALEVPPAARPALLEKVCGDDDLLRNEVYALLAAEARGHALLEEPLGEFARLLMAEIARVLDATTPSI